jgi:hypothetical protein
VEYSHCLGAWRSLVARTVRVGEVPGSNPGAPILQDQTRLPPDRTRTNAVPGEIRPAGDVRVGGRVMASASRVVFGHCPNPVPKP